MTKSTWIFAAAIVVTATGCGVKLTDVIGPSKQATETRQLTAPHVAGTAIDVRTTNGAIDVATDATLTEVKITANVTAYGETEDEAKAALETIKVIVKRRDDQTLEVSAGIPNDNSRYTRGCSFTVRLPDAKNCKLNSGNGSITCADLAGRAEVHSGNGSITVNSQKGDVAGNSGNGSITINKAAAVDVKSSNGRIVVNDATGSVNARSGSGSIDIKKAGGAVEAHSSNGSVTIDDAAGNTVAHSGSGSITINGVKGTAKASTSNGRVDLKQVTGAVDASSGSGSIMCHMPNGANAAVTLKTSNGSVNVTLPGSAGGTIDAHTSNGHVTVDGARKPTSVSKDSKNAAKVVLTPDGPQSKISSGSGSITITLE